jgi:hypothetical protein
LPLVPSQNGLVSATMKLRCLYRLQACNIESFILIVSKSEFNPSH